MTNEEKLNEQIKEIAELFKAQFSKEELEEMEKKFNAKIKELNETKKED
jgi:hypothetical protein